MAILLNDNVQIYAPKALDNRYGPYASLELAKSSVASVNRHLGLTVGIGTTLIVEYWWKAGIEDTDLVLKTAGTGDTLTAGTGVTILGGEISIGQDVATTSGVEFADLVLGDGTEMSPSLSFTSEPSSGLYRSAGGSISVGIGGVKKTTVSGLGLDVFGELNLPGTEFTTTLQLVPPTEDRLISFPNRSGTVLVTDEAGQFRLDDLSDVDLSAGLYEKATICWSGSTETWVVGPDYWEGVDSSNLKSLYRVVLGELDSSDGGSAGPKLKVHGDTATTGDLRLGASLYLGYRPVDDGPDIPARAGAVLQSVFEYELDYFNGSVSPDSNVTILTLDPPEPGFVMPRSVEFTIQIESSDGKYQVVKLSGIRATNTEWNQTVYGLISNFDDPVTNDVGKLYNFSLQTVLSGSVYITVLKAYATGNVSELESYKITGFYIAIGTNPPQTPPPTNYNFNSTWLNNSSLQSIFITGNPA